MSNKELIISVRQRLIDEHLWIENVVVRYMRMVMSEYVGGGIQYNEYVEPFIKIVGGMLKQHFKFEEDEVFPLFPHDPTVKEYIDDHKEADGLMKEILVGGGLETIRALIELIYTHTKKEHGYIIARLDGLLQHKG